MEEGQEEDLGDPPITSCGNLMKGSRTQVYSQDVLNVHVLLILVIEYQLTYCRSVEKRKVKTFMKMAKEE